MPARQAGACEEATKPLLTTVCGVTTSCFGRSGCLLPGLPTVLSAGDPRMTDFSEVLSLLTQAAGL